MATNFEFYKDEILRIARNGYVPILTKQGKIGGCGNTDCEYCAFSSQKKRCREVQFEWFYAEHIEQPKLTKRERAFCEAVQTGWIARDKNGELYWFVEGFKVDRLQRTWTSAEYSKISTMGLCFCFVKWEDTEPWAVADLLKLDVMEVQEDA